MTLIFENGGYPTFPGVTFTNTTEAFTIIRDALLRAGWTVLSGSPASPPVVIRSGLAVNGVFCEIQLISVNSTNFRIGGRHHNATSTTSTGAGDSATNSVGHFLFTDGGSNRLWITADEDTAIIIMLPATVSGATNFRCLYVGRLDLNNPSDGWAWVIDNYGRSNVAGEQGYIAKNYTQSSNWQSKNVSIDGRWGWGPFAISLFTTAISAVNPDSALTYFRSFNEANNFKIPIANTAYFYEGATSSPGYFRGFHKFSVNGFCGLDCRTIHTRYIQESNQIGYYMAVANRVAPQGNATHGVLIHLQ